MSTLLRQPFRIFALRTIQHVHTAKLPLPAPSLAPPVLAPPVLAPPVLAPPVLAPPVLESFYHRYLLEHHFPNGTAQRLSSGITDITTDTQHIEVKRWPCWKDAIGQLLVYNGDAPKKELRVYLFGSYPTERKQHAVLHFWRLNIRVFDMFYDPSTHTARTIEYHASSHPFKIHR